MPLYEYVCDTCGEEFEQMMRFSEADISPACPKCGGPYTIKKISRVGSFGDSSVRRLDLIRQQLRLAAADSAERVELTPAVCRHQPGRNIHEDRRPGSQGTHPTSACAASKDRCGAFRACWKRSVTATRSCSNWLLSIPPSRVSAALFFQEYANSCLTGLKEPAGEGGPSSRPAQQEKLIQEMLILLDKVP